MANSAFTHLLLLKLEGRKSFCVVSRCRLLYRRDSSRAKILYSFMWLRKFHLRSMISYHPQKAHELMFMFAKRM